MDRAQRVLVIKIARKPHALGAVADETQDNRVVEQPVSLLQGEVVVESQAVGLVTTRAAMSELVQHDALYLGIKHIIDTECRTSTPASTKSRGARVRLGIALTPCLPATSSALGLAISSIRRAANIRALVALGAKAIAEVPCRRSSAFQTCVGVNGPALGWDPYAQSSRPSSRSVASST